MPTKKIAARNSAEGKETQREQLKRAIAQTVRAIANDHNVKVDFTKNSSSLFGRHVHLTEPATSLSPEEISVFRGRADSMSLMLACHNEKLHQKLAPKEGLSKAVYDSLELTRIEAIGANRMKGMANNLASKLADYFSDTKYANFKTREETPLEEALSIIVGEYLTGKEPPKIAKHVGDIWRPFILERCSRILEQLKNNMCEQEIFGSLTLEILQTLEITQSRPRGISEENEEEQISEDPSSNQNKDSSEKHENTKQQSEDSQKNQTKTHDMTSASSSSVLEEEDLLSESKSEDTIGEHFSNTNPKIDTVNNFDYKIFSEAYDEVVDAEKLSNPEELDRLRTFLDRELKALSSSVSRLANRLQRRLLAIQNRSWDFDLEEGILDTSRITRIVTDPMQPLSFKSEKDTEFRDTVVTLLIDNSGSMRGRPIMVAACCADILARTLERCGVKVEILGFTTKAWKGGESREKWLGANKPQNPGRLNDLRHIIYKTADSPWRRARRSLSLMMREGLLKENIDGEALLWAHQRILARPEQRRILMMISDGAPVDDSTLSVNTGSYLENHLRRIIQQIESFSPVELIAIGIGHDVTRYYRRAVTITDPTELAGAMTEKLVELFDEYNPSDTMYRRQNKKFFTGPALPKSHPKLGYKISRFATA
ncbi:MAG: cobaltochelatase subunit CobT [Hyphomicrobium sp.]